MWKRDASCLHTDGYGEGHQVLKAAETTRVGNISPSLLLHRIGFSVRGFFEPQSGEPVLPITPPIILSQNIINYYYLTFPVPTLHRAALSRTAAGGTSSPHKLPSKLTPEMKSVASCSFDCLLRKDFVPFSQVPSRTEALF